jgi:hypothetical protein
LPFLCHPKKGYKDAYLRQDDPQKPVHGAQVLHKETSPLEIIRLCGFRIFAGMNEWRMNNR